MVSLERVKFFEVITVTQKKVFLCIVKKKLSRGWKEEKQEHCMTSGGVRHIRGLTLSQKGLFYKTNL